MVKWVWRHTLIPRVVNRRIGDTCMPRPPVKHRLYIPKVLLAPKCDWLDFVVLSAGHGWTVAFQLVFVLVSSFYSQLVNLGFASRSVRYAVSILYLE
jgi:hypothetical protein